MPTTSRSLSSLHLSSPLLHTCCHCEHRHLPLFVLVLLLYSAHAQAVVSGGGGGCVRVP